MKSLLSRTAALIVMLFFLSSCAAPGGTPESTSTTSDADRTKAEGTALGALLGGVVGAATGAAIDSNNRGRGAVVGGAIGAVGGGVAGYMYGKNAAERKQQYANEEDRLDGEIAVLQNYNAELDKRNAATYNKIQELKKRLRNLHAQSQASRDQAYLSAKEEQTLINTIKTNEKDIGAYTQELNSLTAYKQELERKGGQSQPQVANLEREINLLRNHINTLDSNNKQMAKLAENLSVRK
jgi:uncharacterized protein YcfJ